MTHAVLSIKNYRTFVFCIVALFFCNPISTISAQEDNNNNTETETSEETNNDADKNAEDKTQDNNGGDSESEEEQPIIDYWRETLMYGIDSQIISIIKKMEDQNETRLNKELLQVMENSKNPKIKQEALQFFRDVKYEKAVKAALNILENYQEESSVNPALLTSAIRYIQEYTEKPEDILFELIEYRNTSVASTAARAIGKLGNENDAKQLIKLYKEGGLGESIKASIILAFGDMKAKPAVDLLIKIAQNDANPSSWRQYACDSLGKIGDKKAIEPLNHLLSSEDALLRAYATAGLSYFENEKVIPILTQALKDDNWRVRSAAAEGLAKKWASEAVGILKYKAEHDPKEQVKTKAVTALGAIGTDEAVKFLHKIAADTSVSNTLRLDAVQALTENHLTNSINKLKELMDKEWNVENSRFLEYLCKHLASIESKELKPLFAKMLKHDYYVIQIYGIRGLWKNDISDYKDEIEKMTGEGYHGAVKKTAESVLDDFK